MDINPHADSPPRAPASVYPLPVASLNGSPNAFVRDPHYPRARSLGSVMLSGVNVEVRENAIKSEDLRNSMKQENYRRHSIKFLNDSPNALDRDSNHPRARSLGSVMQSTFDAEVQENTKKSELVPSDLWNSQSNYGSHSVKSLNNFPSAVDRDPIYPRARSLGSAIPTTEHAKVHQNANKSEILYDLQASLKHRSHNVWDLSMVREEPSPSTPVGRGDTQGEQIYRRPTKHRKTKSAGALGCILYPLKKFRDMYINCCFQIAGAGDLSGLVGGGHTVAPIDLFPVIREDSDNEEPYIVSEKSRRRKASSKSSRL